MIEGIVSQANAGATQLASTSKVFSANNTTVAIPIFGITGNVRVVRLWGVVTTAFAPSHDTIFFQLNDGGATPDLTLAAGPNLNAAPIGSVIAKRGLLDAAAIATSSAAAAIIEPAAAGGIVESEFVVIKKTATTTNIEYSYHTTDAPTSGVMQFFCEWQPRSIDGGIIPL